MIEALPEILGAPLFFAEARVQNPEEAEPGGCILKRCKTNFFLPF
jgi:hypothetical protein